VVIQSTSSFIVGMPLFLVGITVIGLGVSTLGVARTLFVHEYVPSAKSVTVAGIYRTLRHPLFVGGSVASLGLAICSGEQVAIELGVVNMLVVPVYGHLEDRRCCRTLGRAYVDYRASVGGVIPRRRSAIERSALAHQELGSAGPRTGRSFARRE
jgi:protein-S-isoprenylcysteine O-methyltransferase Ste14